MAGTRYAWPGGAKAAVSLTFDDARPSQIDHGLAVLDRYGLRATFYANPGTLAQRLDGWRRAVATGHEVGNHTVTHPCSGNFPWSRGNALEDFTLERMERELLEANRRIEEATGAVPRTFAYPCGQAFVGRGEATRSYVPLVAKHFVAGRGFMTEHLNDPTFCDLAQLGCVPLDLLTAEEAIGWVERERAGGSWIIFAGHDIAPDRAAQCVQAAELDRLCAWLADSASGTWTAPVATVAEFLDTARRAGGGWGHGV